MSGGFVPSGQCINAEKVTISSRFSFTVAKPRLKLARAGWATRELRCNLQELLLAAQLGDVVAIRASLAAGASPDARSTAADSQDWTALHFAAKAGPAEAVVALLNAGADVHASSDNSRRPLHLAAGEGHTDVIMQLLAAGAAANISDATGFSPLHCAVEAGHVRAVMALIVRGKADPDYVSSGCRPLQLSVACGHLAVTHMLLGSGAVADLDIVCQAAEAGDTRVLATLLASLGVTLAGALRDAARAGRPDAMQRLMQAGAQVVGSGALYAAAGSGSVECVQLLLSAGAVVDEGHQGTTPLAAAASAGHTAVMRALLKAGAAVDAGLGQPGAKTALMKCKGAKAGRLLLDAGATVQDHQAGYLPLLVAASRNSPGGLKVLLEAGADVNVANSKGRTALHEAAAHCAREAASLLLEAGAWVDVADTQGRTPLSDIARHKGLPYMSEYAVRFMKLLLAAGADVRAADCSGNSPLHLAQSQSMSRCLLAAGAKVDATNAAGQTALALALALAQKNRMKVLLAAGAAFPGSALTQALQHERPPLYGSWLLALLPSHKISDEQLQEWSAAAFPAAAQHSAKAPSKVAAGQLEVQWSSKEQMCWGVWSLRSRLPPEILRLIAAICCMLQKR